MMTFIAVKADTLKDLMDLLNKDYTNYRLVQVQQGSMNCIAFLELNAPVISKEVSDKPTVAPDSKKKKVNKND